MRTSTIGRFFAGALAIGVMSSCVQAQACTGSWTPGISPLSDPDRPIHAMATVNVGNGPELVVLGSFLKTVGNVPVAGGAKFNGTAWSSFGTDSPTALRPAGTSDITSYDDGSGPKVFVAAQFLSPTPGGPSLNLVCKWDGSNWIQIGGAFNGTINTLEVLNFGTGPVLVAGGMFTQVGGSSAAYVAAWSGTSWAGIGNLAAFGFLEINAFAEFGGEIYAGGQIGSVFAPTAGNLVKWNGSQWLIAGYPGLTFVTALGTHFEPSNATSYLVVAGWYFGGTIATIEAHVALFDGSNWTFAGALLGDGPQLQRHVTSIVSFDDGTGPAIYLGGVFDQVTLSPTGGGGQWTYAPNLAKLNLAANVIGPVGTSLSGSEQFQPGVADLVAFPVQGVNRLVAAGSFNAFGGHSAYLARWDGNVWSGLTPGFPMFGSVRSTAIFDDGTGSKLYASGSFQTIGSIVANGCARWNGTAWEGLAACLGDLLVFDDGTGNALWSLGGGVPKKWTGGASFAPLGGGLTGSVRDMVMWDDGTGPHIWIAGQFQTWTPPGTPPAISNIARWNGVAWEGLPALAGMTGPDAAVYKLVVEPHPGGGLVIAGAFNTFNGLVFPRIAKLLPGYSMDFLGGGLPGATYVADAAIFDGGAGPALFARTFAGVHRYDAATATWSLRPSLGSSFSLEVLPHGNGQALYAFNTTGTDSYLEAFDGVSWSTVASGIGGISLTGFDDGNGWGLFVSGGSMWLGGPQGVGIPSGGVAKFVPAGPTIISNPASQLVGLGQPISLSVTAASASPLVYQWNRGGATIPAATAPTLTIPSAAFTDAGEYDVRVGNGCGALVSNFANVAVRGCDLAIHQPFGPGILAISVSNGPASAHAFTALSLDPLNMTRPGEGNLFGLHIALNDAVAQFLTQAPPFVTTLSASGSSLWAAGPLPAPLIGLNVWGVSTIYDPLTITTIGSPSAVAHRQLQ